MDLLSGTPISLLSPTTTNKQINTDIYSWMLEGICIFTRYDVISYFGSATNRDHATATITDFTITKNRFGKSWKLLQLATSKFTTI